MKQFLDNLLSEQSPTSSMRFMCILLVCAGIIIALVATTLFVITTIKGKAAEITPLTMLSAALIGSGLTGKYFQKTKESESQNS